ncbi:glycosyltransferase 87 family protein [Streptomyces sp. AD55]|uniref:glycosyltransferase 87 family protein n=1 Tax=Streptomyces sp. AD55 TaxID=3242895 RepID=UPI003527E300
MRTTDALRSRAVPAAVWAATRTALLLFVLGVWAFPGPDVTSDVSVIYQDWHHVLRTGTFPQHDVTWQYPPGAAFAVLSPDLLPFLDYPTAFFVLACAADLAVLVMLGCAARRPGGSAAGVWVWVAGVPLLGPTVYARYDVMVAAVAVAALLLAGRHPRVAGALAGFGAMLKVWPALLLVGVRRRGAWVAAVLAAAAVAALFTVTMPGAFAFLRFQRDRGVEVESLAALVLHVARHAGWEGRVLLHYGSVEFLGPYVDLLGTLSLALTGVAFGWLLMWRVAASRFPAHAVADAAFVAVLLFTVTSRVLSPQYLVWLIALAAVCRCRRAGRMRVPAALVLAASAVTVLEFPVWFGHVVASDPLGVTLLFVRNGLLVAATLTAARALWRDTVRKAGPAAAAPERAGEAPAAP